jgi:predicted nucleic acid-binding protein
MRILLDTNIFLNVAREEQGFAAGSEKLLREVTEGKIEGLASSITLMEIKWALYDKAEIEKAEKAVSLVEDIVQVVSVDGETAKEAIDHKIARKLDLLDSIHVATARIQNAILVTRDVDLKKKCEGLTQTYSPEEALEAEQAIANKHDTSTENNPR